MVEPHPSVYDILEAPMEQWLAFGKDIFHVKVMLFTLMVLIFGLLVVECGQLVLMRQMMQVNEIEVEISPPADLVKPETGIVL